MERPRVFADIILPVPLDGLFTYSIPDGMEGNVRFGVRVVVPFGARSSCVGIVVSVHHRTPVNVRVKDIMQVMDASPQLLPDQLRLWQWIADYYMSPVGEVYKAAMPSGLKVEEGYKPRTETYIRLTRRCCNDETLHVALNILAKSPKQSDVFNCYLSLVEWGWHEDARDNVGIARDMLLNVSHSNLATIRALEKKGFLESYEIEVGRLNDSSEPDYGKIKRLSDAQQEAYNQIVFSFLKKNVTLLHGVTSSGKTEIYIHLIKKALDDHQQVLYLVPEIALTVQMMERLRRVFGNRLGIYHSKYSDAERVEIWKKQLSESPYDIILGARSAVFLPFQRLGLVIVDEEHEVSYKQQDPAPRYHARNVALVLAQMSGAKTLLGTATPSMESYKNASDGKYGLVSLTTRYKGIELPKVNVVDIADLRHRKLMTGIFSPYLLAAVRQALDNGEQAILFQNRRGFAPMLMCRQCGWVPHCQHCDVSLTLHRNMNQLTCHYCGYTYQIPVECPACGSTHLQTRGYGTEKIEEEIRDVFPDAKVARMDLDTTRSRSAYERIIGDFSSGHTNILIGTQMVSKGLDFANVSVVGIINADAMLNIPDFRSYEHAFMMMAQVSGRAGRKGRQGQVVLQTMNPSLPVIQQVVNNDFIGLFQMLMEERKAFCYPPFTHLVYIYLKHKKEAVVDTASIELSSRLRQGLFDRVLGPDKPSVARVKTQYIRKIVLKLEQGIDMKKIRQYLLAVRESLLTDKRYASLFVYFDVDPL